MIEDWRNGGFGLYLHWPFCAAKCPYCDFNSHVSANIDQKIWRDAYLSEVERVAALTPDRVLNSVFFGGGTPSLMDPDIVADIIARIKESWTIANDIEITLEANPTSVEAARFKAYGEAGINRVSLGVQALNDADLRRLGRMHSATDARKAFDVARTHFDRVSFDLIYARQGQTLSAWKNELNEALAMAVDHLSLYQLTVEEGTVFGERHARRQLKGLPEDGLAADMFELTRDLTDAHGMPAYEVSNHAKSGSESRHNLIYWRYGDYAGIGPGAHGRLTLGGQKFATEAARFPSAWLTSVAEGSVARSSERLSGEDQAQEYLLMGLRLKEGISLDRYEDLSGSPISFIAIKELADIGMVRQEKDKLTVTDQGVIVLNAILERLLTPTDH